MSLDRVALTASDFEVRAPGLLGLQVELFDVNGRQIRPDRAPETWRVRITADGAPVSAELYPSSVGAWIEGELRLRGGTDAGWLQLAAEVLDGDRRIGVSPSVTVLSVAAFDLGTVSAGETTCRELPGGGRGLRGVVLGGTLPEGVRLWGGCLVADDDVDASAGTVRAAVDVLSGSGGGRRVERRVYDIDYQVQPRLLTPRRSLYAFGGSAVVLMLLLVGFSVRKQVVGFGPGAVLAWAPVSRAPYRGEQSGPWSATALEGPYGRRGLDVASLMGSSVLAPGELWMRPTADGQVELSGPDADDLRASTPDGDTIVARRRLVVPFGSVVDFRGLAIAPLIGDGALAAMRGRLELSDSLPR